MSGAAPASGFVAAGPAAKSPSFLHADFAAAVRTALSSDPVLGPLAAAVQAQDPSAAARRAVPSSARRTAQPQQPALLLPLRTCRGHASRAGAARAQH